MIIYPDCWTNPESQDPPSSVATLSALLIYVADELQRANQPSAHQLVVLAADLLVGEER